MLKAPIARALDFIGLSAPMRAARRGLHRHLSALGFAEWAPLIPEGDFEACLRHALRALCVAEGGTPQGAYLEFGVSRGTSIACAWRALGAEALGGMPMVGFDSFRGMPPEAAGQGWQPGQYRSAISATRRYLAKQGVPPGRVQLVKGWFRDTLTPATRLRLGLRHASVVMVDCDIYTASREALDFVAPLIGAHAVMVFGDWGWRADHGQIGQKEAFKEFMAANPTLTAEALPAYIPRARVILLGRRN